MNSRPPAKTSKTSSRYQGQHSIPSMATPRRPEPPNRIGFVGVIFILGAFGGLVWLLMVIFSWGPYQSEEARQTPTHTATTFLMDATTPSQSQTVQPTITFVPTRTATVTSTATPEVLPFVLDGEPEPVPSVMIRPALGCDWLVIAGQVWDLEGDPVIGLSLHLFGELGGFEIDRYVITGMEDAIVYGESGFEFAIEGLVVDSSGTLFIQLVDTNGLLLSLPYALDTYNDCQQNMILVNFKQVRE